MYGLITCFQQETAFLHSMQRIIDFSVQIFIYEYMHPFLILAMACLLVMAYSHLMFWPDPLSQTLFLCIINDEIVLFGVLGR